MKNHHIKPSFMFAKLFSSPGGLQQLVFLENYNRNGAEGYCDFCHLMFPNTNGPSRKEWKINNDSMFYISL